MSNFVEKYDKISKVGELYLKGHNAKQIAAKLDISKNEALSAIRDHKEFLTNLIQSEADIRDKALTMLYEAEEHMRMVSKHAWDLYERAEENGSLNQMNKALNLVHKVQKDMSELLHASGIKDDAELIGQLQRAKENEQIITDILREVVADCDRCRPKVRERMSHMDTDEAQPVEVIDVDRS